VPVLTRALIRFFVLLVIAAGVLFAVHDYQTSRDLERQLQEEQVQAGKRQVHQFSDAVRRTLERYQFRDLIDRTRGEFVQFEKLSEALLNSSEYISYIHWKNGRGETLLFKGPDTLQKFIISERGITYYQASTSEVREIVVPTPGRVKNITDITSPVLGSDPRLGTISLGIDENKVLARAREAAERLRTRTVLYSSIGICLVGISFLYITVLARKVTRLSDRLDKQTRMAYVGTLASGLVHEIRNPLNGINLNLSLLEEETREAGDERLIASMERILGRVKPNLAHLENISTEFLMFAKPPKLVLALADVGEVMAQTVQFLRPQCEKAGIEIALERAPDLPQTVVDQEKIRQVLLNLGVNAIHAMSRGGKLTMKSAIAGREIQLDVLDTGCGIPKDNQKKLFTLFFSTKEHGVGLGLPIVKRLVEDHGGTITVDSTEGVGTTFRIHLPIRSSITEATGELGDAVAGQSGTERVV
jgi:signal transduction histidine kinase